MSAKMPRASLYIIQSVDRQTDIGEKSLHNYICKAWSSLHNIKVTSQCRKVVSFKRSLKRLGKIVSRLITKKPSKLCIGFPSQRPSHAENVPSHDVIIPGSTVAVLQQRITYKNISLIVVCSTWSNVAWVSMRFTGHFTIYSNQSTEFFLFYGNPKWVHSLSHDCVSAIWGNLEGHW